MRIKYGNVVLNDDVSRSRWLQNLRIGGAPVIQKADLARSDYLRTFDRGNRRVTVSFTLCALFNSPGEAELYCVTHNAALPNRAELKLTTSGSVSSAFYLWQAALAQLPTYTYNGLTVMIDYSFVGGTLALTPEPTS